MNYIEINDGVSLCIDEIEAVMANPDGISCTVRTCFNSYQASLPYNVLLSLVIKKEDPKKNETLNILKTLGSFAG